MIAIPSELAWNCFVLREFAGGAGSAIAAQTGVRVARGGTALHRARKKCLHLLVATILMVWFENPGSLEPGVQ